MPVAEQLDSVLIERLRKQQAFLLRNYRAELAQDSASRATESSRSHLIAVQHTIEQLYGKAIVRDASDLKIDRSSLGFGVGLFCSVAE